MHADAHERMHVLNLPSQNHHELYHSREQRASKLLYLTTLQPIKFTGIPRDIPDFEKRLESTLNDGTLYESEKVDLLPRFLEGEPLNLLKRLQGRSYISIIERLKERFGHPNLVANSFIAELIPVRI